MQRRIISHILVFSIIFFLAISFNVSPFLRGPEPYAPGWRWPYDFVNTLPKIWLPLSLIVVLLLFIKNFDGDQGKIKKHEHKIIIFLIVWTYFFILGVLFFSRSGVFVLLSRIINPGENGQFTAALNIKNIFTYLSNFSNIVPNLYMHAKSHPPGGIILFWVFNSIFQFFPKNDVISNLIPSAREVAKIWISLMPAQKLTAVFSSLFFPLLVTLPMAPIYYLAKKSYDVKIALRSVIIYASVPSVIFFVPLLDGFYNLFPMVSLLLLLKGIDKSNVKLLFLSGIILGIGLLFTLGLVPYLLFYLLTLISYFYKEKKLFIGINITLKYYLILILGILVIFISLLIFNINIFTIYDSVLTKGMVKRSYFPWVFYNFYDFFVFAGIPVFMVFLYLLKDLIKNFPFYHKLKENILLVPFLITITSVDVFGLIRGEAGRLFLIFVPVLVIIVAGFLTDKIRLGKKLFTVFILVQLIQIIVMQEFWVMLY